MVIKHCETQSGGEKLPEKQTKTFTTFGQTKINNKHLENKININTNKLKQT